MVLHIFPVSLCKRMRIWLDWRRLVICVTDLRKVRCWSDGWNMSETPKNIWRKGNSVMYFKFELKSMCWVFDCVYGLTMGLVLHCDNKKNQIIKAFIITICEVWIYFTLRKSKHAFSFPHDLLRPTAFIICIRFTPQPSVELSWLLIHFYKENGKSPFCWSYQQRSRVVLVAEKSEQWLLMSWSRSWFVSGRKEISAQHYSLCTLFMKSLDWNVSGDQKKKKNKSGAVEEESRNKAAKEGSETERVREKMRKTEGADSQTHEIS